jgi:hypothetical protein
MDKNILQQSTSINIPFSSIKTFFSFNKLALSNYLSQIYKQFIIKSNYISNLNNKNIFLHKEQGIIRYIFNLFYNINPFISDRLFTTFDKDNDNFLNEVEFVSGFMKLFTGDYDDIVDIIFGMFNINHNNKLQKRNIVLVLSYIPMTEEYNTNSKSQLTFINNITSLVNETFKDVSEETEITLNVFKKEIKNNISNIVLEMLIYLYAHNPFNEDVLKYFSKENKIFCSHSKLINIKGNKSNGSFKYLNHNYNKLFMSSGLLDKIINNNYIKNNNNVIKTYEQNVFIIKQSSSKNYVIEEKYMQITQHELLLFNFSSKTDVPNIFDLRGCFINDTKSQTITIHKQIYELITLTFYIPISTYSLQLGFTNKSKLTEFSKTIKDNLKLLNINEKYIKNEEIGYGQYSKVYKGINTLNSNYVAIKAISKKLLNMKSLSKLLYEIQYMKLLKHKHIMSLIELIEDQYCFYLIMSYAEDGDLFKVMHERKLTEKEMALIIKNVAQGVKHFNQFGIVHRDLKSENLLIETKGEFMSIKISDFGIALTLGEQEYTNEIDGTLTYLPPEVLVRKGSNRKADVWSIGIILYQMVTGEAPFDDKGKNEEIIGKKIVYTYVDCSQKEFRKKSNYLTDLIEKCLEKKEEKRITIDEVLKNVWIKNNK